MRVKFGDILLSLAIALAAVLLMFFMRPSDAKVKTAIIMQDNHVIERIDLNDSPDRIIQIENVQIKIAVQDGRIRFIESSCADKTCVNTGWIDSPGEMAVCLPNKVLIKIVGEESSDIDIIAE